MTTHNPEQQYEIFQQHRQALLDLIDQQAQVLQGLEMSGRLENVRDLEQRVKQDTFKVLVIGVFNAGKSTFINALLHEEVLPSYGLPCTALINKVKWGDEPQAVLHYQKSEDGSIRSPLEIPVEELEEYVVIKDFSDNPQALDSPYESVELFWPLDLCRNEVEIIDSPGLNENPSRQRITLNYLTNVDAVLFVLNSNRLGPAISEQKAIKTIRSLGHEDIFFICNRFDQVRRKEQAKIREYGLSRFGALTNRGAAGVFFISALDALEGWLDNDTQLVQKSAVPPLESALAIFLTQDRGRIKIQGSVSRLKDSLRKARRTIPQKKSLLQDDLDTLAEKNALVQIQLQQLDKQRQQIVTQVNLFRQETREDVRIKANNFYSELTQQVPTWIEEYLNEHPVRLARLEWPQQQIQPVFEAVLAHVKENTEVEFSTWKTEELELFLHSRLEVLKRDLDQKALRFIREVDQLRLNLTQVISAEADEIGETISPLERILAGIGGFVIGGIGSAGIGAVFGWKEMAKSLLPQIALGVGALVAGLNPIALVGLLLAGGAAQSFMKTKSINDHLKEVAAQQIQEQLHSTQLEEANKIAQSVMEQLGVIEEAVDEGFRQEIKAVQDLVESSLAEKHKGQAHVDQKLAELKSLSDKIDHIDEKLDELVHKV